MADKPLKILVLSIYPTGTAPSARFRYEQFAGPLAEHGVALILRPFLSHRGYAAYRDRDRLSTLFAVLRGVLLRLALVLRPPDCDAVFVHREAMPFASSIVERLLKHMHRLPLIYDFDDAIWLAQSAHSPGRHRIRTGRKIDRLISEAAVVIAGNLYLADYARRHSKEVRVIPTVVDTAGRFSDPHQHQQGPVTIGWTGSSSSIQYLKPLAPVLREVERLRDVRFVFISDHFADLGLQRAERVRWSEDTEVSALRGADIGLMPLPDDDWTRGKCGFKIIQYMALGIVPVASPVGANLEIIRENETGFLCDSPEAWRDTLLRLIDDPALRARTGAAARAEAEAKYSVAVQTPALLSALRDAVKRD